MVAVAKDNATRFVDAFHTIEKDLRRRTNAGPDVRFYRLVDLAAPKDAVIARHQVDLKEWADLRNAIVHEKTRRHIARPFAGTVREIERIAELLRRPPLLRQVLGRQRVHVAEASDPVGQALKVMYHQRFSQMPVYSRDRLIGLLTAETFARFVAASSSESAMTHLATPIVDVLPHEEDARHYELLSRSATSTETLALFDAYEAEGRYLDAIIVTRTGRRTERPTGIVTVFDVPRLQASL
jgi:CBS domain-containing protein